MTRSQGILVAVGLAALAAMAAPYLTRAVVDSRAIDGKAQVFEGRSQRVHKDLVLCLIKRPGALNVEVASHDFYTDPASGLALKVVDQGAAREVRAWLPEGRTLGAAQVQQLKGCVG
ncbi:MAG: hypothetical protein C0515_12735 [Novosphingobium sp.]|nr:hypothetical protein [Novosphingobium sp.]MBX9644756.1 hypothetical protein [Novosphingobium sp.]